MRALAMMTGSPTHQTSRHSSPSSRVVVPGLGSVPNQSLLQIQIQKSCRGI